MSIFRAYDIRGIYPKELNCDITYKIAVAFANKFNDADEFVVGRDCRISSPALRDSLVSGFKDSGKDVLDIGVVPTPVFYFAIAHLKKQGGIIITGSHNPKDYNGLKIQREEAIPVTGETGIYEMEKMIEKGEFKAIEKKGTIKELDIVGDYIDYVSKIPKLKRPLKIVLDCGNGACGTIPERIFKKLGCVVETLYAELDGNFPNHQPDPHDAASLKALQKRVIDTGADCGFAYDGDGDRIGVVDETGRIVSGDFILMMLARQALDAKKGAVIFEVRSSRSLLSDVKNHGGTPQITRAGHSFLLDEIVKRNAVFGGELSGHMYFPYCYYNYDDGIFASLKIAEIVSGIDSLSAYVDSLPREVASPEISVGCADDRKFKAIEEFKEYLKENNYDFLGIDGARINFKHGWALARASNTTPHIKCRFEADTKEHLDEIMAEVSNILKKFGVNIYK
ncbi:MAG: phosphomannomutase/phosphoglucomutase [Candidatus Aenigmarchaeota archaeon]|nr:phosphomannomutase/phosphoglucomutase [Candidatus Aenigmarchaeota archaeon]